MKVLIKKGKERRESDDTLFGLLLAYKRHNTYISLLVNEKDKKLVLVLTDNPANWRKIPSERYVGYRRVKRVELNVSKLSVKYLSPKHIYDHLGASFGIKFVTKNIIVENHLSDEQGYYLLECPLRYLPAMALSIKKIISFTPQKKYEIIETYLVNTSG